MCVLSFVEPRAERSKGDKRASHSTAHGSIFAGVLSSAVRASVGVLLHARPWAANAGRTLERLAMPPRKLVGEQHVAAASRRGPSSQSADIPPVSAAAMRERQQLDRVERDLLHEIHRIQARLAHARHRSSRSQRTRFIRPASSLLNLPPGYPTSKQETDRGDRRPCRRVVSVSFRLPHNDHRASARQQLFDTAVPPKAALSLPDAIHAPFVWVGSDPPDARSDPDTVLPRPHPRAPSYSSSSSRPKRSLSPSTHPHYPAHQNVHVALPEDPVVMHRYHTFCEHILWRLLHYDYDAVDDPDLVDYWRAYRIVNHRFAETVADICEDGDIVWVHNFHLMLLPAMLRDSVWYARIGFFLYTPFPSAELFRILPHRAEILHGVIGADVIGFHSYDHAKQFVTSTRRLLGLEATPSEIIADPHSGRTCKIGIYPGGIDVDALDSHITSMLVKSRVAELRARFEGIKVVVGVDRLDDCFAGLLHKLLAFERLLSDNPHLVGKVILVQAAMLPKQARSLSTYRAQRTQLNECVARVNSAFGTWSYSPIHFINTPLDPTELHALMCVGHVCVVTTVRDAMGLVPHEWTVCQNGTYNGAIVLSEFASAAHSFSTALHVNPWDIDEVAAKIKVALEMGDASRLVRNEAAYRFVTSHTAQQWGTNFLEDLDSVDKAGLNVRSVASGKPALDTSALMHAYLGTSLIPSPIASAALSPSMAVASSPQLVYGEHLSHMRNLSKPPVPTRGLDPALFLGVAGDYSYENPPNGNGHDVSGAAAVRYTSRLESDPRTDDVWNVGSVLGITSPIARRSHRACLFILDLDGTLILFHEKSNHVAVPQRVIDAIQAIVEASLYNYVLITSSRGRESMMETFGDMRVFLAAEDGAFFRVPGSASWSMLFRDGNGRRHSPGNTVYNGDNYGHVSKQGVVEDVDANSGTERQFCKEVSTNLHDVSGNGETKVGSMSEEKDRENGSDEAVRVLSASTKASISSHGSLSSVELGPANGSVVVSWKDSVVPVMQHFVERTPGAVLEEGEAILTWHYREAENDYGHWQSRQVHKHLESFILRGSSIGVISDEGDRKWIRVRPKDVDKIKAVERMVKHVLSDSKSPSAETDDIPISGDRVYIDFVLCIGDDKADEAVFEVLQDNRRLERIGIICGASHVFTCRVGATKRTAAGYSVESPTRVVQVLEAMCGKQAWAFL